MHKHSTRILIAILAIGFGLSACNDPSSTVEPYRGSITGYVQPYSGCDLMHDRSGFTVRLRRSGKSMITDSTGTFRFDNIDALIQDTIDITKAGFWPHSTTFTAQPERLTNIDYRGIFRIDPARLEFVGQWWVRDTVSTVYVDSSFYNHNGDLVTRNVYRQVQDTVISIGSSLTLNGAPAPARYRAQVQYIHPGWPQGSSYGGPTFSLYYLRSYGVKSGDTMTFYGQAYDATCMYSTLAVGVRDSVEFIMP